MKKKVVILGSTGSIGTQSLDVIKNHPDIFELEAITANKNADLLIEQSIKFAPKYVAISDEKKFRYVSEALSNFPIIVLSGEYGLNDIATLPSADIILTALVGISGLFPTVSALKAGKNIALANKETLVVAGELITSLAEKHNCTIIPVDSEHSAIFQCLIGEEIDSVEKIILTASGGPFRGKNIDDLNDVTKEQALMHPNWCMGNKITIDSATLMNKGFEAIEAQWLFNLVPNQIEIIIHPQSIIHSIVQFKDGSMKAQMGLPDMRIPIQYALGFPKRLSSEYPRFDFNNCSNLTFEKPDNKVFRNLDLAFSAMNQGGNMPCIINAANEVAVDLFLKEKIRFTQISDFIEDAMMKIPFKDNLSLEDYITTDNETRKYLEHY